MYWRRQFPELELFESDVDRREAFQDAERRTYTRWRYRFNMLLWGGVICLGLALWRIIAPLLPIHSQAFDRIGIIVVSAVAAIGHAFFIQRVWRDKIARELRRTLKSRGIDICLGCGYDMRGSSDSCPECGETIDGTS